MMNTDDADLGLKKNNKSLNNSIKILKIKSENLNSFLT